MSFTQKLVAAIGTALFMLVVIGVLSYRRTIQEDDNQKWVSHTYLVIEKLDAVLADLTESEADQKENFVSAQKSHRNDAVVVGQSVREDVGSLRKLTADNPKQQDSLDQLDPLINVRLTGIKTPFDIDKIKDLISKMRLEEQGLLNRRVEATEASSRNIKTVIVFGNILSLVFLSSAALVIHHEMDRRRRGEEELRKGEERFRLMVSNVKDYAIFMLDPTGHIVSWNDGAQRIKGYTADEVIGQHFSIFYPAEDLEKGKPVNELKVSTEQGRVEDEGWRVRKDGSRFWANVVITALRDEKRHLQGFVKVTRDMTERKESEEKVRIHNAYLEAANKELEAFCYSVSHDLRAPLRGIDGFSQALLEDNANQLDKQGKEYLQRVRTSAQRMATLIDDLLNLSRVTRSEMRRETVNLSSMVDAVAIDLHTRDPERKVCLAISPGLQAKADPHLLRIVLENLIGNSWKFTSTRENAQIEIGCVQRNDKTEYFVRDNGVGFNPAYTGKLFGAFQRLHGMNEFPGTGIGLATVQRIIHRHGGRIWAEAAVDRGATFYFTL